jgi:hypothetical protein
VLSLPTEILAHIGSFLAPTLERRWIPEQRGEQYQRLQEQHKVITSLQLAYRRFAIACRPFVWRTVCFSARDELHAGPAALMALRDKNLVQQVRWETARHRFSDMSSVFVPLLPKLVSFAVVCVDQSYRAEDYQLPLSLLYNINSTAGLRHLELSDLIRFGNPSTQPRSTAPPSCRSWRPS